MDRDRHVKTDRESMKDMAQPFMDFLTSKLVIQRQAAVNVLSAGYMYLILLKELLYLSCTERKKRARKRRGREREGEREGRGEGERERMSE